jgi:iron complex outermembrane receptor protein
MNASYSNPTWIRFLLSSVTARISTALIAVFLVSHLHGQAEEVFDLNPFQVEADGDGNYQTETSNVGTIVAVDRDLIPFRTSVVTDTLISDMRIDNPADLVEQIAGVSQDLNPMLGEGGTSIQLTYRVRGFATQPLYNGFQTGPRLFGVDNIGSVEVSKGPNSILYGQSSGGGIVNFNTKRPPFDARTSASAGIGSNNYNRFLFETGGPIEGTRIGQIAFRVGGSYLGFEREQAFFESDTSSANTAFSWKVNDRFSVEWQAEYQEVNIIPSRTEAFVSTGSGPDRVVDPFNRLRNDRNFSYYGPYSKLERDTLLTTLYLNYKISDSLRARVGGFHSTQDEDMIELIAPFGLGTSESATARYAHRTADLRTDGFKLDLLHEAVVAGFNVRSLVGYEVHDEESNRFESRDPNRFTITIPFDRKVQASDFERPADLSAFSELRTNTRDELSWTNIRFTQFLTSEDDVASLMWGVARGEGDTSSTDYVSGGSSSSDADDTTYTLGGTYKIISNSEDSILNNMIVFANYSTSFLIQSGNQQNPADFQGFTSVDELRAFVAGLSPNAIEPQTGSGYEAGLRFEMNHGKFDFTITYFDQSRENIARSFFVRESNVAGVDEEAVIATFQLASGEERSKGIELAFNWNPIKNFTLTGEAMFSDGEVVSNIEAPEEEGFGLVRSPEDMVSLWARYTVPMDSDQALSGLTLGIGFSYNSSTRIRPEINDRYRVSDDYTNVRALVRYSWKTGVVTHDLNLNVDNLLDDEWTNEANFLSEPITFKASYGISF